MEIHIPEQRILTVTIRTDKRFAVCHTEKTGLAVTLDVFAWALGCLGRVPLVGVMATGTGNRPGIILLTGLVIEREFGQ